ncbi:Protein of unknown function [Bacillus wiedmannii]|uniref:Uncharacterized protein n=1 Tax=Bacillus wiedmannii TaxID=1890302 RepID=A0A1C4GCI4_9BACI|nr:Protein of unknown function [Bacillus wiedmannii]
MTRNVQISVRILYSRLNCG